MENTNEPKKLFKDDEKEKRKWNERENPEK